MIGDVAIEASQPYVREGKREPMAVAAPLGAAALPLFLGLIFLFIIDPVFLRATSDDPLGLPLLGNIVRQVVLGSLYVLAAVVLWAHPRIVADVASRQQPMLLLLAFAYLSALWSFSPGVTLTRATHFAGLLLLGWSAHCVPEPERRIVSFLRWLFVGALLASLLQVIVDPAAGINAESGAWAGIHPHKSDLGGVALFCLAVWLPRLSRVEPGRRRLVTVVVLAFTLFMMVQTDSETELLGSIALVLCWIFFRLDVPWPIKLAAAPAPLALALVWFWSFQGGTMDSWLQFLLGRDSTLTGRTPLWEAIMESVRQHPLLGAGYDGFWVAGNTQAEYLIESVGWDAYHAHNGYLEVLNTIGLVGALLLAITLLQAGYWAWRYYQRDHTLGLCFFLLLLWLLISNLTKSTMCQGTTHGWFMYLLSYVCVAAGARGYKPAESRTTEDRLNVNSA